jgi:hypothetical protein
MIIAKESEIDQKDWWNGATDGVTEPDTFGAYLTPRRDEKLELPSRHLDR